MSKGKRQVLLDEEGATKKRKRLPAKATFTITADEIDGINTEEEDEVFGEKVARRVVSLDDEDDDQSPINFNDEGDSPFDDSEPEINDGLKDEYDSEEKEELNEKVDDEVNEDKLIINEKTEGEVVGDMKGLREQIQAILMKLEKKQFDGKSRAEVIAEFKQALVQYFDYSEYTLELLFQLFKPSEFVDFLEANETPRPVTIRTNSLKTRRRELAAALIARGVNVEPLDKWTPIGLQVFEGNSKVPVGATPEYLAGHYMLQAAASLLPVMALGPAEGMRCLDMCAAPGGKSTHIAALMRNTGFLACNDLSEDRIPALVANLHRMGVQNAVTSCMDGRKLPGHYGNACFERVLLDAPCSGTGIISKDPEVKGKTADDFKTLGQLQRELLLAALDMCTVGGVVVYSTCSVTVEENEAVVEYALGKRSVKIVDSGLSFGVNGFTAFRGAQFDKNMSLTRRYYPHTHNLDGFFVAKLHKIA